jgi:formylglycine-generating enzyme required for sulfatase activity
MTVERRATARYVIPTEDEWYKAAYHKNDGVTGNYWDSPVSTDTPPTAEAPPGGTNSANFAWVVGHPTNVGAYNASASPYGTFDQGGNVWEWAEAIIRDGQYSYRLRRGASAYDGPYQDLLAAARYSYGSPTFEYASIGFRVALVPEPATLAVLLLGSLALVRRRR